MLIFACFQSCVQSVSVPIPDYMFLATICFYHRNNHLSLKNTFERLTICIGENYQSVQFTCTINLYRGLTVISFSLNGRSSVHYDLLIFPLKCHVPYMTCAIRTTRIPFLIKTASNEGNIVYADFLSQRATIYNNISGIIFPAARN